VFVPVLDVDALLDTVERFAATLTGDDALSDVLRKLSEQLAVVLGVSGVGVVLVRQGRLGDVIATVEAIADLERVAAARETGPSADALRNRQPVVAGDLTGGDLAQRWPEYVAQAEAGEIRAVAAVPMFAGERVLGVLGLYDGARHRWTDEELRAARIMANIASCYLVHASETGQERVTNEQLRTALTSRIIIEQAKGVLAEARGIPVDEAFEVLRKHSRDHNARIHDVAAAVVNLHMRP
jgi:GAF domain-containing protein